MKPQLEEEIPPVAGYTADRTNIEKGDQISFTDESINTPSNWSWSFGDGGTSTDQHPKHTYTAAGIYSVSLTVSNEFGSDNEIKNDFISVNEPTLPPIAAFTANWTTFDEHDTVLFTDQSINGPTSWSWSFGDGGTSTEQHPVHTYTTAGDYSVTLTVANESGSDSETKTDYITVVEIIPPPVADFGVDRTNINNNDAVRFTDLSTNSPTSWIWDFGDGGSSTNQNPWHEYTTQGVYTVSLTVSNATGSDTETKTDYITVRLADIDGNSYEVVVIGNQTWMAENLKTTRYSDGSSITHVYSDIAWSELSIDTKAYCWYDDDISWKDLLGALYTWSAAIEACPSGWHLPSDEEWKELEMAVGLSQVEADMLGWRGTNEGSMLKANSGLWGFYNNGTNESGFSALPGGVRYGPGEGSFDRIEDHARFWTSTDNGTDYPTHRILSDEHTDIFRYNTGNEKSYGYSVRCVKD